MQLSNLTLTSPFMILAIRRLLPWSLGLTLLLLALSLAQHFYGLGFLKEHSVQPDRIQKKEHYYRWHLPEAYRTPLTMRKAWLFEEGEPWLNKSRANRDLQILGPGWFHLNTGGVNFVPPDGVDPRSGHPRYTVKTPLQLPNGWWRAIGLFLVVQVFLFCRLKLWPYNPLKESVGSNRPRLSSPAQTLFIGLVSFVVALAYLWLHQPITDDAFMVKGVPQSDALAWFELARHLSEGEGLLGGFSGQRLMYPVTLAAAFTFFGSHLWLVHLIHAAWLAVAASTLFALGSSIGSRWVGLSCVVGVFLCDARLDTLPAVLSKNIGMPLAVIALAGCWWAAVKASRIWAHISGMVNGLAAVTSGITIFSLPLFTLLLFFYKPWSGITWRKSLALAALYTLGAALWLGGSMIHQKMSNGRYALSYSTAEVLAGGANKTSGHLDAAMFRKAREEGANLDDLNERYDYFMNLFRKTVAEDPVGYAKRISQATFKSLEFLRWKEPGFHLTMLLALIGFGFQPLLQKGYWIAVLLTGLTGIFWSLNGFPAPPNGLLFAAALFIFLGVRQPERLLLALLLISTVLADMLMGGMTGNVAPKRFWLAADWSALFLLLWSLWLGTAWITELCHRCTAHLGAPMWITGQPVGATHDRSSESELNSLSFCHWFSFIAVAGALASLIIVGGRTALGPTRPKLPFSKAQELNAVRSALTSMPTASAFRYLVDHPKLHTRLALLDEFQMRFRPGEGTQHWLPEFAQRPYERWVAEMRTFAEEKPVSRFSALGTGSLDGTPVQQMLLIAGVVAPQPSHLGPHLIPIFETVLIIPITNVGSSRVPEPDLPKALFFAPSPEALAALHERP